MKHIIPSSIKTILGICIFAAGFSLAVPNSVTTAEAETKGPSGLPLPRFVSLKAQRVNMRVGPGRDYKVEWMYTKAGLPLEILQEYDNWRKVRDPEGNEGWILHSLLSGERTAIVAPWDSVPKRRQTHGPGQSHRPSRHFGRVPRR